MPKERFASLPLALGSLSFWQVLLDRGVFVHWGVLGYNGQSMRAMGFMVGALIHVPSLCLEGQGTKVSLTGGPLCLSGQSPIKILTIKAWASFPGWQNYVRVVIGQCWEI